MASIQNAVCYVISGNSKSSDSINDFYQETGEVVNVVDGEIYLYGELTQDVVESLNLNFNVESDLNDLESIEA